MLVSSCHSRGNKETAEDSSEWRKLECGLYRGPEGELGFATEPEIANVPKSQLAPERCANVFITQIGTTDKRSLESVIDTLTFEALGSGFYKDKSHIYNHHQICEAGYLTIFSDDTSDFRVLGADYVGYQSEIYHFSNGPVDADPETFKTSPETGPYAKDKYGYFDSGERISEKQLRAYAGQKMVDRLKEM